VWLNEGIAQWLEGKRSDAVAGGLLALEEKKWTVSLRTLEGSWTGLSGGAAAYAYAWSLAAVEYIIRSNGMRDVERILERLPASSSAEAALRDVLRMDYSELEAETLKYVRRQYGR
jgi:hypothetical protein